MEFDKNKTYFFWVGNDPNLSLELQDFFFENGFRWIVHGTEHMYLDACGFSIHNGKDIRFSPECATINQWIDFHKNNYKNPVFITDSFDVLDDGSF